MLRSWIHATLAGVLLAFTIPMKRTPARPDAETNSALHRLERALHLPVGFFIVPIFGLASAGLRLIDLPAESLITPITLGVRLGLSVWTVVGIFGFSKPTIPLCPSVMPRSDSHTAEPPSLMRHSYAGFCLIKNNTYVT